PVDGWHIWTTTLTPLAAVAPTQITSGQFSHRAASVIGPLPSRRMFLRADDSQLYVSPSYPASQTIDARYAGSLTVDTRNAARIGLQGNIQDVMRYTYDNGRRPPGLESKEQFFSRETIGVYLTPDTDDEELILSKQGAIATIVRGVLPIQV